LEIVSLFNISDFLATQYNNNNYRQPCAPWNIKYKNIFCTRFNRGPHTTFTDRYISRSKKIIFILITILIAIWEDHTICKKKVWTLYRNTIWGKRPTDNFYEKHKENIHNMKYNNHTIIIIIRIVFNSNGMKTVNEWSEEEGRCRHRAD